MKKKANSLSDTELGSHREALLGLLRHCEAHCGKKHVKDWLRTYQSTSSASTGLVSNVTNRRLQNSEDSTANKAKQYCTVCASDELGGSVPTHGNMVRHTSPRQMVYSHPTDIEAISTIRSVSQQTASRVGGLHQSTSPDPSGIRGGGTQIYQQHHRSVSPLASQPPSSVIGVGSKRYTLPGTSVSVAHRTSTSPARQPRQESMTGSMVNAVPRGVLESWRNVFISHVNSAVRTLGNLHHPVRLRNETLVSLQNILSQGGAQLAREVSLSSNDPFFISALTLFQLAGYQLQCKDALLLKPLLSVIESVSLILNTMVTAGCVDAFVVPLLKVIHAPQLVSIVPEMFHVLEVIAEVSPARNLLFYFCHHLFFVLGATTSKKHQDHVGDNGLPQPPSPDPNVVFIPDDTQQKKYQHFFVSKCMKVLASIAEQELNKIRYVYDGTMSSGEYLLPYYGQDARLSSHARAYKHTCLRQLLKQLRAAIAKKHFVVEDSFVTLVSKEGQDIRLGKKVHSKKTTEQEGGNLGLRQENLAGAGDEIWSSEESMGEDQEEHEDTSLPQSAGEALNHHPIVQLFLTYLEILRNEGKGRESHVPGAVEKSMDSIGNTSWQSETTLTVVTDQHAPNTNATNNVNITALSDLKTLVHSSAGKKKSGKHDDHQKDCLHLSPSEIVTLLWEVLMMSTSSDGFTGSRAHATFSCFYLLFPTDATYLFLATIPAKEQAIIVTHLVANTQYRWFLEQQSRPENGPALVRTVPQLFNFLISAPPVVKIWKQLIQDAVTAEAEKSPSSVNSGALHQVGWLFVEDPSAQWATQKVPGEQNDPTGERYRPPTTLITATGGPLSSVQYHRSPSPNRGAQTVIAGGESYYSPGSRTHRQIRSNVAASVSGAQVFSANHLGATDHPSSTGLTTYHRASNSNTYMMVPRQSYGTTNPQTYVDPYSALRNAQSRGGSEQQPIRKNKETASSSPPAPEIVVTESSPPSNQLPTAQVSNGKTAIQSGAGGGGVTIPAKLSTEELRLFQQQSPSPISSRNVEVNSSPTDEAADSPPRLDRTGSKQIN